MSNGGLIVALTRGSDPKIPRLALSNFIPWDPTLARTFEGTATGSGKVARTITIMGIVMASSFMVFGDVGVGMKLKEAALVVMESVRHKNI